MAKTVGELRTEYRAIRALFVSENSKEAKASFDASVKAAMDAPGSPRCEWTPEDFVAQAKDMTTRCGRCAGTGSFITYVENGQPKGPGGICFRCGGKGYQNFADVKRNETHDQHYMAEAV